MMDEKELAAIEARCEALSAETWEAETEFTAHARIDIPVLIAEVRRQKMCLDAVKELVGREMLDRLLNEVGQ